MRKVMRRAYTAPKMVRSGRVADITQDPIGPSPGISDPDPIICNKEC